MCNVKATAQEYCAIGRCNGRVCNRLVCNRLVCKSAGVEVWTGGAVDRPDCVLNQGGMDVDRGHGWGPPRPVIDGERLGAATGPGGRAGQGLQEGGHQPGQQAGQASGNGVSSRGISRNSMYWTAVWPPRDGGVAT